MALNGQDDVNVGFGASIGGLQRGVSEAVRAVQTGTTQMKSSLDGMSAAGSKLLGVFAVVTSIFAGGRIFSAAVSQTVEFGTQVGQLSRRLYITAGEASAMAVAIDDAFLTVEQFNTISGQLNRQLRSNEEAFNALGVKTRTSNGGFVDQRTLLLNTLDTLREYKGGTDQLLAAQTLLGRGMTEDVLQKLFDMQDNMKEATEASREMGQVMGAENVAAAKEFKKAQDNVGDAVQGVQIAVGNALIPVLTQLLGILSKAAASFIPVVSLAFKGLAVTVMGVTEVLYGLWQVFKSVIETVVIGAVGIADIIASALSGDFAGAKAKWAAMTDSIATSWEEAGQRIDEQSRKSRDAMRQILGEGGTDQVYKDGDGRTGGKTYKDKDADDKAAKERLEMFKRTLALMKQEQGDFGEFSKEKEAEYWRDKLTKFKQGSKEWMEVNTLYLAARRAAAQEAIEIQRFELQEQIAAAGNDAREKLRLANEWLSRMRTIYGADSKQYRDALREKNAADRELAAQQRQIADMRAQASLAERQTVVEMAREEGRFLVEIGRRTQQEQVQLERDLLNSLYQLQVAEIERKRQLYAGDLVMQEQLNAERKRLDAELQRELGRNAIEQRRTLFGAWGEMLDGMFSTLGSVTQALLQRTMTWRAATQQVMSSLLGSFIDLGVKRVRDWVLSELMMTGASKAGNVARAAAAAAGSGAAATAKAGEATVVIAANAAEAATGAAASQSMIPVVGPALAMAAAAAMFAFVMGFGGKGGSKGPSLPSAAGGWWDIPRDTLAMVHAREMVMPAHLAEGVRSMVENGGPMGGGMNASLTIHAVDAQSVERLFMKHSDRLVGALHTAWRNNPRTRT